MKYVSGIRPSGKLHLGNYLGVLKQWKNIQLLNDSYFFIADMHGQYTIEQITEMKIELYKLDINANIQSSNKNQLLSLMYDLSFFTKASRLDNMCQYKEKGGTLSLYSYPVLMAADIILHKGTHIPVGKDQLQHIELVRELARVYGAIVPEPLLTNVGSKIMGLRDATKKMSKSSSLIDDCLYMSDSADTIKRKISKAPTSASVEIINDNTANLITIYKALGGVESYTTWKEFKEYLIDLLIKELGA